MIFSREELSKLDIIKTHIILQAARNDVEIKEVVTDKIALQYALSLAEKYINELVPVPEKKKGIFRK